MATARLDMRIDAEIKKRAERASALEGYKSLTEYLVRLVDQDASRVIAEHESITLEDDIFDRFAAACNEATEPNRELRNALDFARKKGFK